MCQRLLPKHPLQVKTTKNEDRDRDGELGGHQGYARDLTGKGPGGYSPAKGTIQHLLVDVGGDIAHPEREAVPAKSHPGVNRASTAPRALWVPPHITRHPYLAGWFGGSDRWPLATAGSGSRVGVPAPPPVTLVPLVSWQLLVALLAAEGPEGLSTHWGHRDNPRGPLNPPTPVPYPGETAAP